MLCYIFAGFAFAKIFFGSQKMTKKLSEVEEMLSENNFGRRMTVAESARTDLGILAARAIASIDNFIETSVPGLQLPVTKKIPLATAVPRRVIPDGYGREMAKALKEKLTKKKAGGGMCISMRPRASLDNGSYSGARFPFFWQYSETREIKIKETWMPEC